MEEHRLTKMVEGYDPKVFEDIYNKTENYRKKLARQIDARRFGVDHEEVLSWFDVKFIFAFNKYYHKHNPEILKGHIIQALGMFKWRIMRLAYTSRYSQSIINYEDTNEISHLQVEHDEHDTSPYEIKDAALQYMQENLSPNAFELLYVQLYPPPYILKKLEEMGIDNINKIPNSVILDYLELGTSEKSVKYLKDLKKEIKLTTQAAKEHFTLHKLS